MRAAAHAISGDVDVPVADRCPLAAAAGV